MNRCLRNITACRISLLSLLLFAGFAVCRAEEMTAEVPKDYEHSVVMVITVSQDYDYTTPWKKGTMSRGLGSGFVIEGGRILTNAHNVANQRYIEVKKQNYAKRYPAQVQFVGHDCDLAILTVADPTFFMDMEAVKFGGIPEINSTVQTCGFPMGGRQISITEGVVSRLETSVYSHSQADQHLVVQTDAAINPGNSGGPVFQDEKVVGVAFQGLQSGDNIGYMIPTTVIDHFLKDIEDGHYDGFGKMGISMFPGLHNASYKEYLMVPANQDGIVITDILLNSTLRDKLKIGDVITKIGDYNVDNDGQIMIDGLSLELSEAVDRKQIGQDIDLTFYRKGKEQTITFKVVKNDSILPWNRQYDKVPQYRVYAGLTFVVVSRNYLETWGRSWITDVPFMLRYLFIDSNYIDTDPNRLEYVALSEVLPDEVNAYTEGFKGQVVESVNGMKINKLEDLDAAFKKDVNGYWIVRFMGSSSPLVMNAEQARQRQAMIRQKYEIPTQQ